MPSLHGQSESPVNALATDSKKVTAYRSVQVAGSRGCGLHASAAPNHHEELGQGVGVLRWLALLSLILCHHAPQAVCGINLGGHGKLLAVNRRLAGFNNDIFARLAQPGVPVDVPRPRSQ
jgi:hypothetical protein